jgi:hypothetical protein
MNTHTDQTVSAAPPTPASRQIFVDWLRIIALGLLILYHVGMYYVGWSWHVKSAWAGQWDAWLAPLMRLTSPWRMTLLFLVSGMATSWMLAKGGSAGAWLGDRARRLLMPLVVAVVLVVPPQAYFEVVQFHGWRSGYLEFLGRYFSADGSFCANTRGCLILPTWNHLWFLPYLFVYTALLWFTLRRRPGWLDAAAAFAAHTGRVWRLVAAALGWMLFTRLTLRPWFGETHALVDDLFLHTQYGATFFAGAVLARSGELWPRLAAQRHLALGLALAGWIVFHLLPSGAWRALPWSLAQVGGVIAAFGYAHRHLRFDGPWRQRLSRAVFPVYLLHQTVTIVLAAALAGAVLAPVLEAPLLAALTLAGSLAGYALLERLVRRRPALAPWFGIGRSSPVPNGSQGAVMREMALCESTNSSPCVPTSMSTGGVGTLPKL